MIALIVLAWIACGIFAAGAECARRWPASATDSYREDLGCAVFFGIWGTIAVLVAIPLTGFLKYGWTLLPPKKTIDKP